MNRIQAHRLQLRHLHCFLAVARLGHLGRAAQALSISQPAVTKTLADLEALLGLRLFERGRRGARLTPAGQGFLRHASQVMAALDQALDSVAPGQAPTVLRLGALPTVAHAIVAAGLRSLGLPAGTTVHIETGANRELLARLQQGTLDAVVGRLSEPEWLQGLTFEHLYAEPLIIAVRPDHPLRHKRRLSAAQLADYDWILPVADTIIRHNADSWLQSQAVVPRGMVFETLSVSLGRELAASSDALWFTPSGAIEADLERGVLARLPLALTGTEEPVGWLMRSESAPSPALQAVRAALREQAKRRHRRA
ncbi:MULTISPECIES: pca operon transcription factor PcaQ [Caldimonas]|uniref:pca operon transcription factor PcaQ n=1 Tax=Caldimonas TaxID=196013 RepID=UPI00037282E9|nr:MULTISPECIES: pca operon transcription factor PcaQ [Caldimonas]MCX7661026.1 pca operon transcription factor PcaQ [Caldimonas manganoxidans]GIX22775.1 MAG: pca operon transcription factor PcaQ [Caldimonas sp.]